LAIPWEGDKDLVKESYSPSLSVLEERSFRCTPRLDDASSWEALYPTISELDMSAVFSFCYLLGIPAGDLSHRGFDMYIDI